MIFLEEKSTTQYIFYHFIIGFSTYKWKRNRKISGNYNFQKKIMIMIMTKTTKYHLGNHKIPKCKLKTLEPALTSKKHFKPLWQKGIIMQKS